MVHSFKVASTLAAQRVVYVSAANTVAYFPGLTTTIAPIGVTDDTVDDTTSAIPVKLAGERAKLYFNDTVSAGALVTADSSGRGVPFTAVTAPGAFIGILLGSAVSATGTIAEILVQPGFESIP